MLTGVRIENVGLWHTFEYGTNGAGELTKVTYPYGADTQWGYTEFEFGNHKALREVNGRWLRTKPGGPQWVYTLYVYSPSGSMDAREARIMLDNSTGMERVWFFERTAGRSDFGYAKYYEERYGAPTYFRQLRQETTWVQDAYGRSYAGTIVSKLDAWTGTEKTSKMEFVRDTRGNIKEHRIYDYTNLTTPKRTYTNTFVDIGLARLPSKSELTEGTQTLVLGEWKYDGGATDQCSWYFLTDVPNLTYHDGYFGTSVLSRGLVSWAKGLGQPAGCVNYDIGGNVVKSWPVGGAQTTFSVTSASQWTAPSTVTPNGEANLASSFQWDQYLGLSSVTGPNGASSAFTYDSMARPQTTTSPHGVVTTYSYNDSPSGPSKTATTNGKWVKTTMDGLGRTIKTESGYGFGRMQSTLRS